MVVPRNENIVVLSMHQHGELKASVGSLCRIARGVEDAVQDSERKFLISSQPERAIIRNKGLNGRFKMFFVTAFARLFKSFLNKNDILYQTQADSMIALANANARILSLLKQGRIHVKNDALNKRLATAIRRKTHYVRILPDGRLHFVPEGDN